ncbi:MAG TPA: capsule assembly Wzi family protein [Pedobacter sp.]
MKNFLIIILFSLLQLSVKAQFLDSLQIKAGTAVSVASQDYLPLWLVSNRFGVVSDQKFDFTTHFGISNSNRIGPEMSIYDNNDRGIYFNYGLDAYNNDHLHKTVFEQAFVKARYKNLTLSVGRFEQIIGEVDHDLSTGSLGVSGNALPIPKINLSLDYTDVPFTNGWLQFKGMFSHGWMGPDQFMKHAFLHEKNLYLRIGKGKFKLYGGIQHYAVWGGENPGLPKTDRSLAGFLDVVLVKISDDGTTTGQFRPNRSGDQRGVIEAGAEWEDENTKIDFNNQTPFDSGQGIDIRNRDRLLSLNITDKRPDAILKKITFEFISTKQMNDFYASRYRESYYNNGVYRTGWEYNDMIIGTPLFVNRVRGSKYFDDVKPYDWNAPAGTILANNNIIGNRVVGGHVGFVTAITDHIYSKTMITYTMNYGTYTVKPDFYPARSQYYSLEEVSWDIKGTQLAFTGSVAYDWGGFSHNFGSMFGLRWELRK